MALKKYNLCTEHGTPFATLVYVPAQDADEGLEGEVSVIGKAACRRIMETARVWPASVGRWIFIDGVAVSVTTLNKFEGNDNGSLCPKGGSN